MGSDSFCFRVPAEDGRAFRSAADELGLGLTDTFLALVRLTRVSGTPVDDSPIVVDGASAHELSREVRSIGTLYNQSVTALNTIAKFIRGCDADADDARRALERVDVEMEEVLSGLRGLCESASAIAGRPVVLP